MMLLFAFSNDLFADLFNTFTRQRLGGGPQGDRQQNSFLAGTIFFLVAKRLAVIDRFEQIAASRGK